MPVPDRAALRAAVTCWEAGDGTASTCTLNGETGKSRTHVQALYGTNIGDWDVSRVQDFSDVFCGWNNGICDGGVRGGFTGDVSAWNTSAATSMVNMFRKNIYFNGDISMWDVSKVRDFENMFAQ